MKLLDAYFALQSEIYAYFGYEEDWAVIPLDDCREMYWNCNGESVAFATSEAELVDGGDFVNAVHHLPRWIYYGKDYTMIVVDTQTDGNKFLQVFSNDRRREPSP